LTGKAKRARSENAVKGTEKRGRKRILVQGEKKRDKSRKEKNVEKAKTDEHREAGRFAEMKGVPKKKPGSKRGGGEILT